MVRVLVIAPFNINITSNESNGIANFIFDFTERLSKQYEVFLMCSQYSNVEHCKMIRPNDGHISEIQLLQQSKLDKFDIIHSHLSTFDVYRLKQAKELPICQTFHDLPTSRILLPDTPCLISASNLLSVNLSKETGRPIRCIYDSLIDRYHYSEQRGEDLLYDGNITRDSILPQLIKNTNGRYLYIIGPNKDAQFVTQLYNSKSNYFLLGDTSRYIQRYLYSKAKYLICGEPMYNGLSIIKAMLSGCSTLMFGKCEFVKEGENGLYTKIDTLQEQVQADPLSAERVRAYYSNFNFESMFSKYMDMYEHIMSNNKW